jgi:hypothetical protein
MNFFLHRPNLKSQRIVGAVDLGVSDQQASEPISKPSDKTTPLDPKGLPADYV